MRPSLSIRDSVKKAYSTAAEKPEDKHPFPVGRNFAESIGYPKELLDVLPSGAVDTFTGVSNVSMNAHIPEGSAVLDLGCGAGMDTFIAARRGRHAVNVIGIDFSESMISRARHALSESGYEKVQFQVADAEQLPLDDSSIDVALVNGIFNLSPDRKLIFDELARVVRKGGAVYSAELILNDAKPVASQCDLKDWFA